MTVRVKIKGIDNLTKKLDKLDDYIKEDVADALEAAAMIVEGDAKQSIQRGPKTGLVYTKSFGTHQASAPGEPPASDTGRLANSVDRDVDKEKLEAIVGTDLEYGLFLEEGTVNIEARPWLRPAMERNREKAKRFFQRVVDKAIDKATK